MWLVKKRLHEKVLQEVPTPTNHASSYVHKFHGLREATPSLYKRTHLLETTALGLTIGKETEGDAADLQQRISPALWLEDG